MKRFISLLLSLVLVCVLSFGCLGPKVMKPEDPKTISVLLDKANKCPADEQGWKVMYFPGKKDVEKHQVFGIVYVRGTTQGFGFVNDAGMSMLAAHDKSTGMFVIIQFGVPIPIDEPTYNEWWAEWVKIVAEDFDITKAQCGKPPIAPPSQES